MGTRNQYQSRFYLIPLCIAALAGGCSGGPSAQPEQPPTAFPVKRFEGTGQGFRGPIRVAVETGGGIILGIEILDHEDDPLVGGAAMEELREQVLDENTTSLDALSGASESSAGFLQAVENALEKAGHSRRRFPKK
ncbi:MAG: FMN-binding protein [Treponema sp.]|jgi:hypothetical protein|nr:FMN-binding protein [Treponema sp.]